MGNSVSVNLLHLVLIFVNQSKRTFANKRGLNRETLALENQLTH